MENNLFPDPAVAGVLAKNYVEARLHTDGSTNVERIRELQHELTGSVATPIYVLLDPRTGEVRGKKEGSTRSVEEFARFLESGLRQPQE